uniref:keratin, type I cytoskeletal 20 n=1 Tax=Ictidomys tridecemlineatus TaxID=43179 RepID=UPI00067FD6C9|nr:keratin, type I cytoskeletal 20 [Ictidomys tridecemlineatus]
MWEPRNGFAEEMTAREDGNSACASMEQRVACGVLLELTVWRDEKATVEITDAQLQNARCVLQIDNAKLAVEDFRLKFETERGMRLTVEADLQGLSRVFDDLTLRKTDLEVQIEELNKDLILLKKEHQEEVDVLRRQLGNTVNVELDAAPGLNLGDIMNEMRQKYEVMAQKNLQEAKEQFERQTEALQQQVLVNTEELKGTESQVTELRRTYQNLEIELQTHLSMVKHSSLPLCNPASVYQV